MFIYDWLQSLFKPGAVQQARQYQSDTPTAHILNHELALHPSRGLTPARLTDIFQKAEQGLLIEQAWLFMDMEEKDAHIGAEMFKRKMAVKKLDWNLQPPRNPSAKEKKATVMLEQMLRDELDINNLRFDLLDGIGHGYSCTEMAWGKNAQGLWMPVKTEHRPANWFTTPPFERNKLHLRDYSQPYGVALTPYGWIVHLHKTRAGYIARTGLFRALAWPYLYKNYSVRDLAEFLEIYGLPIRVGKYPSGTGDDEKWNLMKAVLSIGHNAAGIIPDSMQLELHKVNAQGGGEGFKVMIDWAEGAVSKAILGGTLTSQTGKNGNRSLGDVHNEVRMDIRDDDATQTDTTITLQLIKPICAFNELFAPNRHPRFQSNIQEPDDVQTLADALPKLVQCGVQIPLSYVNNKLKIPIPEPGEPVLSIANQASTTDNQAPQSITTATRIGERLIALSTQSGTENVDRTPISSMADQLADEAAKPMRDLIDQIFALVEKAQSLQDLRDTLLNSYSDLDASQLIKIMTMAFAAADLAGQYDVKEDPDA